MLQKNPRPLSAPRFLVDYAASGNVRRPGAVLVALDGAAAAEQALPQAQILAEQWNAPLSLVHVRNPVEDAHKMDVQLIDNQESLSAQTRSGAYLKELAESLRDASGLSVSWETTTGVSIVDTLRSICETDARALVLVRTRKSLLTRFLWGSITDRLIGRLPVPLLVVPEGMAGSGEGFTARFNRVLACVDGTEVARKVVDGTIDVATADAVCHLLRVLPLASWSSTRRRGMPEAMDLRAKSWLELSESQQRLEQHGIACKPRLIFDGQAAGPAIIDQARATQAGLIVVAARPYLLPRWLRDGVAEYVVRHASVPVLVVPARESATAQPSLPAADFRSN